ncbi:MAG: hypothetical protein SGCHY_003005 [Lobulomycetales sp.]
MRFQAFFLTFLITLSSGAHIGRALTDPEEKRVAFYALFDGDAARFNQNITEIVEQIFGFNETLHAPTINDTCPICIEEFGVNATELDYCKIGCKQWVHRECQRDWIMSSSHIAPHCVLCKAQWLDIPSAWNEQLDYDDSSERDESLRRLDLVLEELDRLHQHEALRAHGIDNADVRFLLVRYLCFGYPGVFQGVRRNEYQRFTRLFPTQESLETFLDAIVTRRPLRVLRIDISRARDFAFRFAMFVRRHLVRAAKITIILFLWKRILTERRVHPEPEPFDDVIICFKKGMFLVCNNVRRRG